MGKKAFRYLGGCSCLTAVIVFSCSYSVHQRWERVFSLVRSAEKDPSKFASEPLQVRTEYDVCGKTFIHREEYRNVTWLSETAKRVWDAARALSLYLEEKDGCGASGYSRVLELGAGTGLLGMWRSMSRPGVKVVLTDMKEESLILMRDIVKENQISEKVEVRKLPWAEKSTLATHPLWAEDDLHFDEVLGSDVVHGSMDMNALLEFLVSIRHPKITIWLMTERRNDMMITDFADPGWNLKIPWKFLGGKAEHPAVNNFFKRIKRYYNVEEIKWAVDAPGAWAKVSALRSARRSLWTDEGLYCWARQGTLVLNKLTSKQGVENPPPKPAPDPEAMGLGKREDLPEALYVGGVAGGGGAKDKKKEKKPSVNKYWPDDEDQI